MFEILQFWALLVFFVYLRVLCGFRAWPAFIVLRPDSLQSRATACRRVRFARADFSRAVHKNRLVVFDFLASSGYGQVGASVVAVFGIVGGVLPRGEIDKLLRQPGLPGLCGRTTTSQLGVLPPRDDEIGPQGFLDGLHDVSGYPMTDNRR